MPADSVYDELRKGSGKQAVATTMAFVRLLKELMKDPVIGERFAPIIPDEARTFGMDSLFPTAKIYSPSGQTYEAVDRNLLLSYKESEKGQILHEGISESGAMGSVIAAGSSYATHGTHMIPVYVFYSMFGWQRTGDEMWLLGDQLGRGFLLGATAGRTTLTGEGLQHNDGHSLLLASVSEACVSYDCAWAFELAYVVRDALRRMYEATPEYPDGENIFYYLTLYNEPYPQPAEPADFPGGGAELEDGILRGLYLYAPAALGVTGPTSEAGSSESSEASEASESSSGEASAPRAQILASGIALRQALTAQEMLATDWGVSADVWSATSWTELRRDALACESWNMLHPGEPDRVPYLSSTLADAPGPVVAVSDWIKAVPDQIARWVPGKFTSLGTDGFGFSDTRPAARRFFHVDAESITVAVLWELARTGAVDATCPPRPSPGTGWTCRSARRSRRPAVAGLPAGLTASWLGGRMAWQGEGVWRVDGEATRQAAGPGGDRAADGAGGRDARYRRDRRHGPAAALVPQDVGGEPVLAGPGGPGRHRRVPGLAQAPGA